MKFSSETLMAYADGELDAAMRTAVEAEMAADPRVAAEIARHRELKTKLDAAFGGIVREAVPPALIATARTARATTVADLSAARDARQTGRQRTWAWPEWSAIAASLLLGVLGSRLVDTGGDADIVASNGKLIANGALASALESQAAGSTTTEVRLVASFRAKGGEYCRTFTSEHGALAGLACRDTNQWAVRALAQSERATAAGDYRMAATALPPAIAQAAAESMQGEALDAADEAAALASGWRR